MSSTNRKNASKRHVADYYVTPKDCILGFLRMWVLDMKEERDTLSVYNNYGNLLFLDPCAGGDEKHEMSYPSVIEKYLLSCGSGKIDTVDIREDSLAETRENFLEMEFKQQHDVVITNPPFNIAQDIIEKSFEVVQTGGYVIMLLRLNFLGSKGRKEFWEKYPPNYIYVHHKRMSFTDDGGTDSIEYAHFVWRKGDRQRFAKLRVI